MKHIIGAIAVLAVSLYAIAEMTMERTSDGARAPLRWATDPNPARTVQTGSFSKMFPGFSVEVDPGPGGDQTKLIVRCATGFGPDIIDVYGAAQMWTLVEAGVLLDLTPYADELGIGPDNTWRAIRPALSVEGKLYRYPCNIWANCVIYNKAIFDDHGVPYPKPDWTYQDFIRTCQRLQQTPSKSGEDHMTVANWGPGAIMQDLLIGCGGRFFSRDGLRSALDSAEAKEAMRLFYDLMFTHKVLPTSADLSAVSSQGGWGSYGLNIFSIEKAAMIFIGRWYIIQMPNFPGLKGKLGAVLNPRIGGRPSAGLCGTRAAAINVKSPRWREAMKFLRYLASPEYSQLIARDGDSLPPNPRYARRGEDLVNSAVGDPAFHQVFLDAMERSRAPDFSPFIEPELVGRWLHERVGEVENELMGPEEAMKALAAEINQRIRLNLERRGDLQKKYEALTGRPYRRGWWKADAI